MGRAIVAAAFAALLCGSGCYAYDEPGDVDRPEAYVPDTFEGRYVDFVGDEPYYTIAGEKHFIPHERPEYAAIVAHHRRAAETEKRYQRGHPPQTPQEPDRSQVPAHHNDLGGLP